MNKWKPATPIDGRMRTWLCDCGSWHGIRIHWSLDGDPNCDLGYLSMDDESGPRTWDALDLRGWAVRLQAAWRMLLGRHHTWSEVVLTPEMAREIAAELTYGADQYEAWAKPREIDTSGGWFRDAGPPPVVSPDEDAGEPAAG